MVTREYLWSIFYYNEEEGSLYYQATDKLAATTSDGRYARVNVGNGEGRKYEHHVIWFMIYGEWPTNYIDHKDGNGFNNRLDNLRECTMSQNIANSDWSPIRCIERHGRKFRVRPVLHGIRQNVGSFNSIEEARVAYLAWAEKHFGEFAFHNRE